MISIVTGTLNRLEYLPELINNTIGSDNRLELILVDGGSTDGSIRYLKGLNNDRIRLIENSKRSYYWDYMNLGIKSAQYDYICQWNDDVLLENKWNDVIEQLNDEYQMYIFSWFEKTCNAYVIYDFDNELVMNFGIYNKKIFKNIGMYNNSYKYYYCDGDMSYRAKSFGYKYKKMYDIKCRQVSKLKVAFIENDDLEKQNYFNNLSLYNQKILPTNLEYI